MRTQSHEGGRAGFHVVWEGPQAPAHSFALSNREFCLGLHRRGHHLTVYTPGGRGCLFEHPRLVRVARERLERPADIHVRHEWPPSFEPPSSGRWVVVQPWEIGSIPAVWVGPMTHAVDEVWAYTRLVRDCDIASGVPADRVHVLPLGVDPGVFRPQALPRPLDIAKRLRFLLVGGTIHRKGIDVLLNAYASAFTTADDVCLNIQDFGTGTFYRRQTAGGPEVLYLDRPMTWPEPAGLYPACDCLVHPYRGDGLRAARDRHRVRGGDGLLRRIELLPVLARPGRLDERRVGDIETVDHPWLAEPDVRVLAERMRRVAADPAEARRRGRRASTSEAGSRGLTPSMLSSFARPSWPAGRSADPGEDECVGARRSVRLAICRAGSVHGRGGPWPR